jgi:hypothetical protein
MARPRNPELHSLWRRRIRRQVESGMTITQFCGREALSIRLFHAWKRRFRLFDLADHPAIPVASAPPAFLPVAIRPPEHTLSESLPIVAELPKTSVFAFRPQTQIWSAESFERSQRPKPDPEVPDD